MKEFAFLIVVVLAIIPQGYGLKCHACQENSQANPNGCQTPTEVTCPVLYDRCFTLRSMTEMNMPGGGSVKMTMEMRNCSFGAMMCNEAYKQQMCQNTTGGLKSCNYSCCDGNLCNDGTTPPGSGLTPSKPASNVSLSCYECADGMGPNATGTPSVSCSAPRQKKCGEVGPGMPYDRCTTVKSTVKNPNTGALVEQQMKGCGLSSMCNTQCNNMNSTGILVKCDAQCCQGNLCNSGPQTTVGPTGPKAGQTPLAISGTLVPITIVMALLFK